MLHQSVRSARDCVAPRRRESQRTCRECVIVTVAEHAEVVVSRRNAEDLDFGERKKGPLA